MPEYELVPVHTWATVHSPAAEVRQRIGRIKASLQIV